MNFPWTGTVYGVLLNFEHEWQAAQTHMHAPPYQAPPQAPVLYIKTANTWTTGDIVLPAGVTQVEVGATLGAVMDAQGQASALVLLNDVSLPHSVHDQGFYRPPVTAKCRDGFLGVLPLRLPVPTDLSGVVIEVHVNGAPRQRIRLSQMRRTLTQLLHDVRDFMQLQAGDVLMLGCDVCTHGADAGLRPRVQAGDQVHISVHGLGVFAQLKQTVRTGEAA